MTTSGTVSQTVIDTSTLLEHVFRRAGKSPAEVTPDLWQAAKNNLYFYLSSLSNDGVNLWTLEPITLGLYKGQDVYQVGPGTVDIRKAYRRTLNNLPAGAALTSSAGGSPANAFERNDLSYFTQTSANGSLTASASDSFTVQTVGFMPNGTQTYAPVWEQSFDGLVWDEVLSLGKQVFNNRIWYCYEVPIPKAARFFRLRETSGGTLNLVECIFGQPLTEILITRINIDQYTSLTNKDFQSEVVQQYWLDRKLDNPEMRVWPVPNSNYDQLVCWRTRYIQDVGSLTNTLELPQRWSEAAINNVAVRMIFEIPGADVSRYGTLKELAESATRQAQQEERDKSPIQIYPAIGCYTK